MPRIIIVVVFLSVVGLAVFNQIRGGDLPQTPTKAVDKSHPNSEHIITHRETSLFVPYWTLDSSANLQEEYSYLIYFGIAANKQGIDTSDPGYTSLEQFREFAGNTPTFLTIRMVNTSVNSEILKNKSAKQTIIEDSIRIAKEHGFEGIVLDLEMSSIGFDEVTNRVTEFNKQFYTAAKSNALQVYTTMYGDTYYRVRPYDLKALEPYTDRFLIMAYDFHKSRGNPGPNFPLRGKEDYGYDLETMLADFRRDVPTHKLTVIFGMFGYDWRVDSDGKSVGNGEGKSMSELRTSVVKECDFSTCEYQRHSKSTEMQGSYIDGEGNKHIIWYEDEKSVEEKKAFLKQQGIESYSYWAFSYF